MDESERIANSISVEALLDIEGVVDILDTKELNAIILELEDGEQYRITVTRE